jgi:hypothetical protein
LLSASNSNAAPRRFPSQNALWLVLQLCTADVVTGAVSADGGSVAAVAEAAESVGDDPPRAAIKTIVRSAAPLAAAATHSNSRWRGFVVAGPSGTSGMHLESASPMPSLIHWNDDEQGATR